MNITLSADEKTIKRARLAAAARGTTVNELVRRFLEQLAGEMTAEQIADEFVRCAKSNTVASPEGWKINRQEIQRYP
jgi:hypothetical protein